MSRLTNQLDHVCEDLLRLSHVMADLEQKLLDAESPLRAQSFEPSSAVPTLYCMLHEGDLKDCPEHDLCSGVPVATHADPTGEAGIRDDLAEREHRQVVRDIATLETVTQRLVRTASAWQQRGPTADERRKTDTDNEVALGCEVCARSGKYVPAKVNHSDAKGALDRPHRLCVWHLDFTLAYERLPNTTEEQQHQAGRRVVVRITEVDRLQRAMKTGAYAGT